MTLSQLGHAVLFVGAILIVLGVSAWITDVYAAQADRRARWDARRFGRGMR